MMDEDNHKHGLIIFALTRTMAAVDPYLVNELQKKWHLAFIAKPDVDVDRQVSDYYPIIPVPTIKRFHGYRSIADAYIDPATTNAVVVSSSMLTLDNAMECGFRGIYMGASKLNRDTDTHLYMRGDDNMEMRNLSGNIHAVLRDWHVNYPVLRPYRPESEYPKINSAPQSRRVYAARPN